MSDRIDQNSLNERIRAIAASCPMTENGADLSALFKLCAQDLAALCGSSPAQAPDDWNAYCCRYLLDTYYPGRESVEKKEEMRDAVLFYLDTLNAVFERETAALPFSRTRCILLPDEEEARGYDNSAEYAKLLSFLKDNYLYAFMRLHEAVTPHKTLSHIAGVNYVSVYIARQLLHTEVRVDPTLCSGAAILHDIGKYGCRPSEAGRVPYLHYYYTYQFAQRFGFESLGSTASAHSVWDLELENLSAESLILIYSDFRVKSIRGEDGSEQVCFWTLQEAYDIILSKLDNVDEAKLKRYAKVYSKLKDFEAYMVSLGVSTDLTSGFRGKKEQTPYALMSTDEMVQAYKHLAISHNLKVMYTTGHDVSFISLLEDIRGEKDWRHVRAFLTVIEEYSGYLKQDQKLVILDFLYEMLSHQDGDIRRHAARVIAVVLAGFDISFKKELPENVSPPGIGMRMEDVWRSILHRMLFPSHMTTELHRRWIGYAMKTVVRSLLELTDGAKRRDVLNVVLEHYKSSRWEGLVLFLLLDCMPEIPYELCSANQRKLLFRFARSFLNDSDSEIRIGALRFIVCWLRQGCERDEEMQTALDALSVSDSDPACVRYMVAQIRSLMNEEPLCFEYDDKLLYIENQRSEIPWIYKLVNMEILQKEMMAETDLLKVYQYASHLLNLLQFTPRVTNKLQAGENLVEIMPRLSESQRYEIVLELVRALSMGQYSVAKYIPQFMGRIFIIMTSGERDALLQQLRELYASSNPAVVILTLETVSVILQYLPRSDISDDMRKELEGLLISGTVHYNQEVAREAFYFLGEGIFGSPLLTPDQKKQYFTSMSRKVLTFVLWDEDSALWYYNAASLNYIYRFISDYLQDHDQIADGKRHRIAFFPGTFDPFSLGHKAIVKEIASMGFHVYLAVDEFSWSKNTQPYKVRRKIMAMSVADLNDVFLFPVEIPVNIANPDDLAALRRCFPEEEVYLVAGTDVVANASAYRMQPSENSVHSFPHILFARNTEGAYGNAGAADCITGEVLYLKLPAYFENMSSTRIRSNVSGNKDIADLVEPVVQNYIYEKGLYTMEPMYKRAAQTRKVDTFLFDSPDKDLFLELAGLFPEVGGIPGQRMSSRHAVILRNEDLEDRICGCVLYHDLEPGELYASCGDIDLAAEMRERISGRTCVITAIAGQRSSAYDERYTALNEMLAHCQEEGYSYAVCFRASSMEDVLLGSGFLPIPEMPDCFLVDLRRPLVLFVDTSSFIKEQFSDAPQVKSVLWESHLKLRRAVAALFPGQLLLCFDSEVMNHRLIRLIVQNNPLPERQLTEKKLGEKICVPFGKILKGVLIPDCVTKDLNTEKLYDIDMERFTIRQFPQYTPLSVQIRTIKSFGRPVILVDDLYHKGHRLDAVEKAMEKEGLKLNKLIVGVRSGRGNDLANVMEEPIESVYFVPNMRSWLIESDLYPFIGGDGISVREQIHSSPSLPSVNSILPYHFPSFMKGASMEAFYNMSQVCLENSRNIFLVLEKLYQDKYGRKLTMSRTGEVLAEPRHPDTCILDTSSIQESPSLLLEREMQKLHRLKHLLDGEFRL